MWQCHDRKCSCQSNEILELIKNSDHRNKNNIGVWGGMGKLKSGRKGSWVGQGPFNVTASDSSHILNSWNK